MAAGQFHVIRARAINRLIVARHTYLNTEGAPGHIYLPAPDCSCRINDRRLP